MRIRDAKARVVLNSRAQPTIEVEINGVHESAPAGASKGSREAPEVDPYEAAKLFNQDIVPVLKTMDFQTIGDFEYLEEAFFSMGGFEKYGANTLIATEYAILRAVAKYEEVPIYYVLNKNPRFDIKPLSNVVGGGAHTKWRGPDIQEFLVLPEVNFTPAVFINAYIHKRLFEELSKKDPRFLGAKNDEGAWVPSLDTEEILSILSSLRDEVKEAYNVKVNLGVDIAASGLTIDRGMTYVYRKAGRVLSREEQIDYIVDLIAKYDLYYVEDPVHEEDFEGFREITSRTSKLIVGDDLTVTDPERIEKAIKMNAIRGVIIKPNQVGSLLKTKEAVELAKKYGITPILSHRSGETESNILAHLAVAFEVPIVKFGIANGERIVKLNELIRLEEKLRSQ